MKSVVTISAVLAVLAGGSGAAAASPAELFGFGSRHAARAGASAASVDDFAAGHYNPAGLAFGRGKRLTLGFLGAQSNLTIEGETREIVEPYGVVIGASTPAPLGGPLEDRVHLGIGLYLPPKSLARVIARLPDDTFFPYYDNRSQRAVVLPTFAVRVHDDVAVGVGINFLATLAGSVIANEGATRAIEARIDEKIPSIARLNAGVQYRPHQVPGLSIAVAFRQSFSIPFSTDARVSVAGEPINVDISADGVFSPTQVIAGAAYDLGGGNVEVDLVWSNWSAYDGPFVEVKSELPLVGPLAAELPVVPTSDTWGVRAGGEARVARPGGDGALWLRGGYAFETAAFPETQSGVTNLFDGNKHRVAAGLGLAFPEAIGGKPLRIDVHATAEIVADRTFDKAIFDGEEGDYDPFTSLRDEIEDDPTAPETMGTQVSNPGYPSISGGGQVYSGGVTMEVGF